jgi:hypothetical protein
MAEEIECRILGYLLKHPSARDTSKGILVWWLPPDAHASAAEVEGALAKLVARGWMNVLGEKGTQTFGLEVSALRMIGAFCRARTVKEENRSAGERFIEADKTQGRKPPEN